CSVERRHGGGAEGGVDVRHVPGLCARLETGELVGRSGGVDRDRDPVLFRVLLGEGRERGFLTARLVHERELGGAIGAAAFAAAARGEQRRNENGQRAGGDHGTPTHGAQLLRRCLRRGLDRGGGGGLANGHVGSSSSWTGSAGNVGWAGRPGRATGRWPVRVVSARRGVRALLSRWQPAAVQRSRDVAGYARRRGTPRL